jgi:U32 family peptidase
MKEVPAKNVEVMAPAGSFESLMAAIKAGANSIYFGVEQLNMRARSSNNFTLDDVKEVVARCEAANVRSYITLNTIIYDHDINLMRSIVDVAKTERVSAIIASDHSVMNYAKKIGMPVHISTQANLTNIESIEFYANFADVMVLSRELTLTQVGHIAKEIKRRNVTGASGQLVRLEVFAHGALCMAVSGKCYLSLHSHNASANRGACVQNCRREYVVTDKEEAFEYEIDNEYIMSAKDLCTIGFLHKIIEAGVTVLKLEGRGRSADYVHTTTQCYREAVEAIADGTYTHQKIEDWTERLTTVFNRGFWDGYYLGRTMGEWSDTYGSKATERKLFLGRGVKYFNRLRVGEFEIQTHSLKVGDDIMITGPVTGFLRTTVSELRVEDIPVQSVAKGAIFSMPMSEIVRREDKLYKILKAE